MASRILLLLACATACFAQQPEQQWELGFSGGYGFYRNATVSSPAGTATAGVNNRFALSGIFGQDMYKWVGGEFRYTFQDGDPFVESGNVKTRIQGQSHAFTYDLLVYFRPRGDRVRLYVIGGLGAKDYRVTGLAPVFFGNIATLRPHDQFTFAGAPGAGVKIRIQSHVLARFDFIDYITPFPTKVIAPADGGTARGILHQFTPFAGLSAIW